MGPDMIPVGAYDAGAMRLIVAVHAKHVHAVTHVEAERESTGFAHLGFDKGAIGVSFLIYRSRLCFVAAHLAAHADRLERRVADVKEIWGARGTQGLQLGYYDARVDFSNRHNVFFFGDLNFRLEGERDQILEHLREEEWDTLHELDQLKNEMSENGLLHGFQEGPLEFPPTYKYKVTEKSQNISRKNKAHMKQLNAREYDDQGSYIHPIGLPVTSGWLA